MASVSNSERVTFGETDRMGRPRSENGKMPVITEQFRELAARNVVLGASRLATTEEIRLWRGHEREFNESQDAEERLNRRGKYKNLTFSAAAPSHKD
jgi:hypothetical protein